MCRELELAAKEKRENHLPERIDVLLSEHEKVLAELRQWQQRRIA